jgi:hypothetical protein
MAKKITYSLLAVLLIIQLIRPTPNTESEMSSNDIEKHYLVPENVKSILAKACRDCHSNNTIYPWYASVQPVAWWLDSHIRDAKKHLNFSEFAAYPPERADHKLEELIESQTDHWMPLESYVRMHPEAKLTARESQTLIDWAQGIRKELRLSHPADFLEKSQKEKH